MQHALKKVVVTTLLALALPVGAALPASAGQHGNGHDSGSATSSKGGDGPDRDTRDDQGRDHSKDPSGGATKDSGKGKDGRRPAPTAPPTGSDSGAATPAPAPAPATKGGGTTSLPAAGAAGPTVPSGTGACGSPSSDGRCGTGSAPAPRAPGTTPRPTTGSTSTATSGSGAAHGTSGSDAGQRAGAASPRSAASELAVAGSGTTARGLSFRVLPSGIDSQGTGVVGPSPQVVDVPVLASRRTGLAPVGSRLAARSAYPLGRAGLPLTGSQLVGLLLVGAVVVTGLGGLAYGARSRG
jgi:hypothetical protein